MKMNISRLHSRFAALAIALLVLGLMPAQVLAAGGATHFQVYNYPSPTTAGAVNQVTVTALDADDQIVTDYPGTVEIATSEGTNLPPNATLNDGTGTFDVEFDTVTATGSITATDTGDDSITGTQSGITVDPASAASLVITGPITATAGSSATYTVTAYDQFSNVVTDYAGIVTVSGTGGAVVTGSPSTLDNGTKDFGVTFHTDGIQTVNAGDGTLDATPYDVTVSPGAAAKLVVTGEPGPTYTADATNISLTVTVEDAEGNTATDDNSISVDLALSGGSTTTFTGTHPVTVASGVATFSGLGVQKVGTSYKFTASSTGLTSGDSSAFSITPGQANKLVVTGPANSSYTADATNISLTVTVEDANGNVGTGDSTTSIDLTLSGGATTTFTGTHPKNASAGVATFNDLGVQKVGSGYKFTATSSGLTSDTSSVFAVTPGAAATVDVETKADGTGTLVTAQSVTAGSSVTVYAIERDAEGNFVANEAAAWSLPTKTGGVVNGDLVAAGDNKSATFTGHLVGTAVIHAVVGSFTANSGTLTVVPGTATQIRVETKSDGTGALVTPQNVTAGSSITVYAITRDAEGNFVANPTANWSLTGTTGGVVAGDLTPASGTSATFTGHLVGTAVIHAAGSFTADSGTLMVIPGTLDHFVVGSIGTQTAGVALPSTQVTAYDAYGNVKTDYSGSATVSTNFSNTGGTPKNGTVGSWSNGHGTVSGVIDYTAESGRTVTVTDTASQKSGTSNTFTVNAAAAESLVISGPTSAALGVAQTYTVTAKDHYGNTASGGTVTLTSSDAGFTASPGSASLAGGPAAFSVTFHTLGSQTLGAHADNPATTASLTVSVGASAGSTYHMIDPVRVLDTRIGKGSNGKLRVHAPITFQVTGGSIPAGASGVTGNVTVTDATFGWAIYVGPDPIANPSSSTLNFVGGETTSNGLTVALSASGTLSATYLSNGNNTVDLVFDVTGYFTKDNSGATYHPITPVRSLDTRNGTGGMTKLVANQPKSWQVAGLNGIPSGATAVTGNVTVVNSTNSWAIYLGPSQIAHPTTSALNFLEEEIKANSVTVGLSPSGTLSATYISNGNNTTDLVFDVTGYYTVGGSGGSKWVPMTPIRVLDTRTAGHSPLTSGTPLTFQVTGVGGGGAVPAGATAVTGNVTVTDETNGWAVFVGPDPDPKPSTSSLNFVRGDVKANGMTVRLGAGGTLSATYLSIAQQRTNLVFDVTGYFI